MIIINVLGLGLIALIVWWFWIYKPKDVAVNDQKLIVTVEDGVYQPAHIKLPANQGATLQFLRKDASPCAESVLFPDLEITQTLPVSQLTDVTLPPLAPGEYPFHCQMNMYRGVLKVY